MDRTIYSVSQVNTYLKHLMDRDELLSGLFVRGEISNYKMYPSGHHYFSLKDQEGALRCVMFRREASRLRFQPEHGMKVIAFGRISVFPRDGQYQLYCGDLVPDGAGALHVAFEQLKAKLYAEGLFDELYKKSLPLYPDTIALITSPVGAALQDMLRILKARWPMAKVVLLPVRVQGAEAPGELAEAVRYANQIGAADLIIIGRGGGSLEDLWAFNDETLARAIFNSQIPVISAVGHEPDVTISDFVADVRAATPSNAAEIAVPDQREVYLRLSSLQSRLLQAIERRLTLHRGQLERYKTSAAMKTPLRYIEDKRMLLDFLRQRLQESARLRLLREKERFSTCAATLDALSPLKVLGRGYAIARTQVGALLKSSDQVAVGDALQISLAKGVVQCTVTGRDGDRIEETMPL